LRYPVKPGGVLCRGAIRFVMHFDPGELSQADRYKLLIGGIVPRPIAWVSTRSPDGKLNLAPFSFFCGISSNPMTLCFCPANREDGSMKDSLRNALPLAEGGTGEFVVNVVSHALAGPMSASAADLPYRESEFAYARVTPEPSRVVQCPRVGEAMLAYECRTLQVLQLKPGVPAGGNMVIGEVVGVFAREGLVNARHHVDAAQLDAIGRMGGNTYCTTRDRFEMARG